MQMGMTRSKRYSNYEGGRKYAKGREGEEIGKSTGHRGKHDMDKSIQGILGEMQGS